MSGLDYVRPDEVAAIPVVQHEVKYVVYGPLVEFRTDPDVVLLFAHAQQSLILSEAVVRVDKGIPPGWAGLLAPLSLRCSIPAALQ